MLNEHLLAEFLSTPWALRIDMLSPLARLLASSSAAGALSQRSNASLARARARSKGGAFADGSIAVIPIYGPLHQHAGGLLEAWGGGTSTDAVAVALRTALADDGVSQILLDIDSPGGSVYGVGELADQVYAARSLKPVVAIANSVATSAAY